MITGMAMVDMGIDSAEDLEKILAWDPDFTKVTAQERADMESADKDIENGEYVSHEDVWKDID